MIETKTLLVVGAGGSVPYGYPTGEKLRDSLCDVNNFEDVKEYMIRLRSKGGSDEIIEEFCQQFKASQRNSIDAFLAARGSHDISKSINGNVRKSGLTFEECGKLAIASQLIKYEKFKKLLTPDDDHWLQYLWQHMSNDVLITEFQNNQLKVVSFNYDRVIEQYFQTTIENTYGVSSQEASNLLEPIEIVHMYGNLQNLTERPYEQIPRDLPNALPEIAKSIRIIPEARKENDEQFTKAKELIRWADKICFIGFGFDQTNVRRLGFPDHDLSEKTIYGTHYGLTAPEIRTAQKLLAGDGNELRGFIDRDIPSTELKTREYLRHAGVFS